jgi:hypothetical protein
MQADRSLADRLALGARWTEHAGFAADHRSDVLIAGARAECGASTLAALLAYALSEQGADPAIVEAGGSPGMLAALLALDDATDLGAYVRTAPRPRAASPLFSVFASAAGELRADHVRSACTHLRRSLPAEQPLVVDAGWRLDTALALAPLVTRIHVVVPTDHAGLAAGYALVKALHLSGCGAAVSVLLARGTEDAAALARRHLSQAATLFLGEDLPIAAWIPEDASLIAEVQMGVPLALAADHSPAVHAAAALVSSPLPHRSRVARPLASRPAAVDLR